jgi:hypothetical protein
MRLYVLRICRELAPIGAPSKWIQALKVRARADQTIENHDQAADLSLFHSPGGQAFFRSITWAHPHPPIYVFKTLQVIY